LLGANPRKKKPGDERTPAAGNPEKGETFELKLEGKRGEKNQSDLLKP